MDQCFFVYHAGPRQAIEVLDCQDKEKRGRRRDLLPAQAKWNQWQWRSSQTVGENNKWTADLIGQEIK